MISEVNKTRIEEEATAHGETFKTGEWFENLRIEAYKVGAFRERELAEVELAALRDELAQAKENIRSSIHIPLDQYQLIITITTERNKLRDEVTRLQEKEVRGDRMLVQLEHDKCILKSERDHFKAAG